jgi:hypothetical protein
MRVLKHGPKPPPSEDIPCTCFHCKCEFVFHESEAFSYVEDSRHGDYYRVTCPDCELLNSVSVKLKGTAHLEQHS